MLVAVFLKGTQMCSMGPIVRTNAGAALKVLGITAVAWRSMDISRFVIEPCLRKLGDLEFQPYINKLMSSVVGRDGRKAKAESAHRELRGCPVGAVFATAAQDELRWHYGGFVFDTAMRPLRGGSRMDLWVRAVFPDGFEDWWSELPDPAFAFLSQGEHVAPERVERARRQFGM